MKPTCRLSAGSDPEQVTLAFARAISNGSLPGAAAAFAKGGCFITPGATAVRGREEIRAILAQMIARRSRIEVLSGSTQGGPEAVLCSQRWLIRSLGVEGSTFEQASEATLVLRCFECDWKLSVAAPWGLGGSFGMPALGSDPRARSLAASFEHALATT